MVEGGRVKADFDEHRAILSVVVICAIYVIGILVPFFTLIVPKMVP